MVASPVQERVAWRRITDRGAKVAECPTWIPEAESVYWIDVYGRCLNKTVSKEQSWTVLAQIGKFTRPEFNDYVYPYELPHVSHPKETISLYLVQMEPFTAFTVSQSAVMVAVPLMHLYKADKKYGDIVAALPLFLSRFAFVFS